MTDAQQEAIDLARSWAAANSLTDEQQKRLDDSVRRLVSRKAELDRITEEVRVSAKHAPGHSGTQRVIFCLIEALIDERVAQNERPIW